MTPWTPEMEEAWENHVKLAATYQQAIETEWGTVVLAAASRLKELEEALRNIADPIPYLEREAREQGAHLNGSMAVMLSTDHNFLRSIAKNALKEAP